MRYSEALREIISREGYYAEAYVLRRDGKREAAVEECRVALGLEYDLENVRRKRVPGSYCVYVIEDDGGCREWNIVDMRTGEVEAVVEVYQWGCRKPKEEDNRVQPEDRCEARRYPWWLK